MKFAEPIWLIAGLAFIAGMLWLYRRFDLRQRAALAEFASSPLLAKLTASFSPGRRRVKRALFVAALAFTFLALARPQRAHSRTEVTANGIDIVLGLDVSGSMQALDFLIDNQRVNRIEVVKSVVSKFIDERPNDRIGLIAFAGVPYLVSPITLDHDWLQQNLERVNIGNADDPRYNDLHTHTQDQKRHQSRHHADAPLAEQSSDTVRPSITEPNQNRDRQCGQAQSSKKAKRG